MIRSNTFLILFSTFCIFSLVFSRYSLLSEELILENNPQFLPIESKICFKKNKCVLLEVANTFKERRKGLMFRNSLKENHGMLFILDKPINIDIWMKNTLLPLDIIFISNTKILNIYENLLPCTKKNCAKFNSKFKVDKIIELNAGAVKKFNIQIGKILEIEDFKN